MTNYKDIQAIKDKRFEPLDSLQVTIVSRAIRENEKIKELYGGLSGEFALRVAVQLRDFGRLQQIEKRYRELTNKTTAEKLREIADNMD
jgi:hypothetical protein